MRERLVVRAAVVVAGEAERDGQPGHEERRRLRQERRPPRRERAEPGMIHRHRARIAGRRREERRRDRRTDVRIVPDVGGVEGAERQVAEEEHEADGGRRRADPPLVDALGAREAARAVRRPESCARAHLNTGARVFQDGGRLATASTAAPDSGSKPAVAVDLGRRRLSGCRPPVRPAPIVVVRPRAQRQIEPVVLLADVVDDEERWRVVV